MFFLISFFFVSLQAYIIYDGNQLVDSWALLNTAGTDIELSRNSTTSFIRASLRCWDTIRIQRTESIDTSEYNFFSFDVYYDSEDISTMKFRTRLFSSKYNQQTETELKPYDYIFKSGKVTKVFIPLTISEEPHTLQTFTMQRIETTGIPVEFRITNITLEKEGIPTPSYEVITVSDDVESSSEKQLSSSSIGISLLSFIMTICFILF